MSDRTKESTYFLRLAASEYKWLMEIVLWERDHYEMSLSRGSSIPEEYHPDYKERLNIAQNILFSLANVRAYPANQPDVELTDAEFDTIHAALELYHQFIDGLKGMYPGTKLSPEVIPQIVWKLKKLKGE